GQLPLPPPPSTIDAATMTAYFATVLGTVTLPDGNNAGVETYRAKIKELEDYFFMTAESLQDVMMQIDLKEHPQPNKSSAWDRVDAILEDAHKEKIHRARRQALKTLHD